MALIERFEAELLFWGNKQRERVRGYETYEDAKKDLEEWLSNEHHQKRGAAAGVINKYFIWEE